MNASKGSLGICSTGATTCWTAMSPWPKAARSRLTGQHRQAPCCDAAIAEGPRRAPWHARETGNILLSFAIPGYSLTRAHAEASLGTADPTRDCAACLQKNFFASSSLLAATCSANLANDGDAARELPELTYASSFKQGRI